MSSTTAVAPSTTPAVSSARTSYYALLILSLINLVNYLDRYIVTVALPYIKQDFQLTNTQAGYLGSFFMLVFMLASPVSGFLGDRLPRRYLVAAGVLLWSLATGASGLATTFFALMVARACVGIGEAGYGAVAPSIISDLFPRQQRTRVLSFFYIAIPVGAAAGYGLGGWLSEAYSWHMAFFVGGAPGLVLGVMAFFMPEPQRGAMDGPEAQTKLPFLVGLQGLASNKSFWWTTAGYTLMTFSIGGLGYWLPTFLVNERGMSPGTAGFSSGAVTATAGLVGTLAGGWLGDKMDRRMEGGGLRMSGVGLLAAAPLMFLAMKVDSHVPMFAIIFLAQFFIFLNSGPINAAIVNGVPPAFRAFAMGLNVLFIHMLGDAISPTAIGKVADLSSLSFAIELNALPVLLGGLSLLMAGKLFRHVTA
ncbi:sugar phosphate permease [Archangium gephyra]|uniref:4-hydroxybenzoate transporter n=1 Tax=Archangium gephyra TaxID=48 RepID=A0AAC8QFR4_9BACT|nr:MFS transporter [Archangium gephyra]AKJ06626.1 4-hydroxybenzoate transporter [Archangium gephyra]REG32065.1 sugar phosphate permease [Archangium gephyra]